MASAKSPPQQKNVARRVQSLVLPPSMQLRKRVARNFSIQAPAEKHRRTRNVAKQTVKKAQPTKETTDDNAGAEKVGHL